MNLPPQLLSLESMVSNIRKKTANEYSSSCPWCGGNDRFVIFVVGKGGFPFAFCRQHPDEHRWYPALDHRPTPEELDYWKKQQIEVEKARIEAAKRTIEILQNDKLWETFFQNNNSYSLEYFQNRGIVKTYIDYLRLGLIPDFVVRNHGQDEYHSPAFTIPVWGSGGIVQNIKLRMGNPRSSADRYRNFYSTGRSFLFVPLYDLKLEGACVVVEGEFKAIVVQQALDKYPQYRVVGLQSMTPDPAVLEELRDVDPVYVWLDPDSEKRVDKAIETAQERLVRLLGKERVQIIESPCKPDDGIVQYGLDPLKYIANARRAK